ncbi:T9SS type A sorting domain-containing protein, partial [bacterium]|nr:T9SS type A sorting domain-containing protein [bacterium]
DNFNNVAEERIAVLVTTVREGAPAPVPQNFALHQNFPNPFNPLTNIRFDLPRAERVRMHIYNTLGREVRVLTDEVWPAGSHALRWDGRDDAGHHTASGIYIVRMVAGNFATAIKILKLK